MLVPFSLISFLFQNISKLESIWIKLILLKLKTGNWKYCNKIIFKCMNSTVKLIFNEKITEKWNLWVCEQYMSALFTVEKSKNAAVVHDQCSRIIPWNVWKPKKKKAKCWTSKCKHNNLYPKHLETTTSLQSCISLV